MWISNLPSLQNQSLMTHVGMGRNLGVYVQRDHGEFFHAI